MPRSHYYHLKFELYATPDLTGAKTVEDGLRHPVWQPGPGASIFDDLPSHYSEAQAGSEQGEGEGDEPDVGEQDAATARDWRFGNVWIASFDMEDSYGGSHGKSAESADALTSTASTASTALVATPASSLGPMLGGAGQATRARYSQLATKTTDAGWGIVHLYREGGTAVAMRDSSGGEEDGSDGTMLCIPAVPSYLTPRDFLGFVGERWRGDVSHYRMVMTSRTNRYMVLLKFREAARAREWRAAFDGCVFNSMEAEICHVAYIRSIGIETPGRWRTAANSEGRGHSSGSPRPFPPPTPNLIELPTCPVCLERMDDTTGLMTILCQHVFHCTCLQTWKGSGCPVCRATNPLPTVEGGAEDKSTGGAAGSSPSKATAPPFGAGVSNLCAVCDCADDLWICLICGNVGCGRYKRGHAKDHWKETAHSFSLELETQYVWDYAGDMWVHRLIRAKGDGKVVELPGRSRRRGGEGGTRGQRVGEGGRVNEDSNPDSDSSDDADEGDDEEEVVPAAKLERIGLEYTHLLTSQLESQRVYFEELVSKAADKAAAAAATAEQAAAQAAQTTDELRVLRAAHDMLAQTTMPALERDVERERRRADKAAELARNLGRSLQEEKRVSEGLMTRIRHLQDQTTQAQAQAAEALAAQAELQEANRDLTMFISGQEKLRELEADGQAVPTGSAGECVSCLSFCTLSRDRVQARTRSLSASSLPRFSTEMAEEQKTNGAVVADGQAEKDLYPMSNWKYDTFLWTMSILVDLFFREVHPRGSWKIPRDGPVLFVAAPHANQFVDALILQRTLHNEAKRRVSLLIAQKSVHGFIGWASRQVGSVPVGRAQDSAKPAAGTIYLPDPVNDPTLLRGVGTSFDTVAAVGSMIFLPSVKGKSGSSVDIAEILGPDTVRLKRPFQGRTSMMQLTGWTAITDLDEDGHFLGSISGPAPGFQGTKFKLAAHIDQTKVYHAVFNRLRNGGCVGIFPEGGSHDRTGMLPLKAGVAIMALGALAESPDCDLRIMPVGMNYFHAHKFRSRAVVEFGPPLSVPAELVAMYRDGRRRDAIAQLLDMVHQALAAVTVSTPDYDTLMLIQAARRLYNPTGKKLPLPMVVELNRRLAMGYDKYKDDERVRAVTEAVKDYNRQLRYLNIRDHQVNYARLPWWKVSALFVLRLVQLMVLSVGVLPGLLLFAPVFVVTKLYSRRKAAEALAGSSVKIQGRDVMATWKLLVAMFFAPILYNAYCVLFVIKFGSDRLWGYVPAWATEAPWWLVFLTGWIVFPLITFAALRFGEVGMDIVKSLRPLVLCMIPASSYNIHKLRERRAELQVRVTDLVNTLGPEMFPDFPHKRLVKVPVGNGDARLSGSTTSRPATATQTTTQTTTQMSPPSVQHRRHDSEQSSGSGSGTGTGTGITITVGATQSGRAVPRNESFSNIGKVGIFPTRPPSRSRSRSSSAGGGFPVSGFTTLDANGGFDEASKKIREAMRERGELRRRQSQSAKDFSLMADEDEEEEEEGEEKQDE
ncbi:glycerol-3-phosphate acyltransferase [Grosmannia clavigera kw1407]|uniref:Glycerol-3-phosphate acyltransferase n=1 Tax=Grosmannia clavigera (strain kw1407 / UAMH 11150) TaxID=655863 RepID=F0XLF5_GROCL|nr:glycerol-3-phosphate acyltransferase [Grosmannia clavigera kw1407]EFX01016.1 glycerol-3-phosphate acyltransferase [Grosmannia clavigera kw1407]